MKLVQKYLKIIGRFHKVVKILQGVVKFINFGRLAKFLRLSFTRLAKFHILAKFCKDAKFIIHSLALCPAVCTPLRQFTKGCEIVECQIPSLILFLAYLIDLAKASKLSKTWILHVIQLQSCFAMDYTKFSLILSLF